MASWFRIQRCPCSGAGSIPGPGSSACRGHVQAFTSLAALLFPEGAWLLMGHDCRSPSWRSSRSEGLAAGPEAHLEATFMLQLGLGEGLRVEPPQHSACVAALAPAVPGSPAAMPAPRFRSDPPWSLRRLCRRPPGRSAGHQAVRPRLLWV